MIVNLIICVITSFIELTTFVIFRGGAILIISLLQMLRVPGVALQNILDGLTSLFSMIGGYIFALIWDVITTIISGFFDFVGDVFTGSIDLLLNAVFEMMKLTKEGLEELVQLTVEILGGLSEIVGKLVVNVWDNINDALSFILEKI